jgi:hypothetical protein
VRCLPIGLETDGTTLEQFWSVEWNVGASISSSQ